MDKGFLLVLLSLQVFLLIAALTSTDAAALMRDPQLPPHLVKRSTMGRLRSANRPGMYGVLGDGGVNFMMGRLRSANNGKEYYWDYNLEPGMYQFALLRPPTPPPRPEVLKMDRPGGRIID